MRLPRGQPLAAGIIWVRCLFHPEWLDQTSARWTRRICSPWSPLTSSVASGSPRLSARCYPMWAHVPGLRTGQRPRLPGGSAPAAPPFLAPARFFCCQNAPSPPCDPGNIPTPRNRPHPLAHPSWPPQTCPAHPACPATASQQLPAALFWTPYRPCPPSAQLPSPPRTARSALLRR